MSGWSVEYNSATALRAADGIERGKHLAGFARAEQKLEYLRGMLQSVLHEASWWRDKAEQAAAHYAGMQKQLRENPQDFSPEHAREASAKSPDALYAAADRLRSGEDEMRAALASVDEIIKSVQSAKECAEAQSVKISDKITRAIELIDGYLKVKY